MEIILITFPFFVSKNFTFCYNFLVANLRESLQVVDFDQGEEMENRARAKMAEAETRLI